jgi:ribosomal protein S18 acetylase RimI-like enzyme
MDDIGGIRIEDVTDEAGFRGIPPCADPGFDHRTCDHWEDADRGSKAARLAWLEPPKPGPATGAPSRATVDNPFLAERPSAPAVNPFAAASGPTIRNPFLDDDEDEVVNLFAPASTSATAVDAGAPRKLQLLARGLGIIGSYAKVLYVADSAAAYCQFGPLTAYPRAQRTRDLYPQLPDSPLPAVITCIATTAAARGSGLGLRLVDAVCEDLESRGFAAVETYPEASARPDATGAATPAFWEAAGFERVVDDPHFPVMRRELG